ncbi:hypothetical protein Tco_1139453 [Tanacetum coccineum]
MGYGIGEFPFTYLGLPIGENMRRVSAWGPVVEKFKNKVDDWKAKTMSFRRSLLGSLPLYYFSMFRVPLSVIKNLERIRKNFFWGGCEEGKKLSWVKWDTVFDSFQEGLLILGPSKGRKIRLYWVNSGGRFKRDIVLIGEEIDGVGIEFSSSCIGVLGDIRRFWFDRWVDNHRLCDRFLRLFHLDRRKDDSVWDKRSWNNNVWCWEWEWVRSIRGREKVLRVENGVHETLWNKLVPKKVNVFAWRALRGRIPLSHVCFGDECVDQILQLVKGGGVNSFTIEEVFLHSGGVNVPISLSRVWQAVI